jgi:magnesium transporter
VAQHFTGDGGPRSAAEVFVELCEEIVDRLADSLEQTAAELQGVSQQIFHVPTGARTKAVVANRATRANLQRLGQIGDRLSDTRSVLLGIGRAVDFARELSSEWCTAKATQRLKTLRQDVASLADYEPHLTDKVQFLLDAMIGLIGITQNDIFKILTIVSIVGIPPTLMAGVYGMNFKYMPELGWAYGYPLGLAVIVLSGVIPLAWFKWKGWF